MNAVNAVQLFVLVWTCTAGCPADEDISVSCEDVTGTVDEEVTLTCSVSLKSQCCITKYKFQYPDKYNDSEICKEEFPQDCEQRNSFTCRFSPTTVMTGQFRFFVQTTCGYKGTEFTVNITETSKPEPVTEDPDLKPRLLILTTVAGPGPNTGESKNTVIAAVMGFIFIIIIMTIIYKKKPNCSKSRGFQRIFLCHKHEDNNSNFQEQNPENVI